MNLRSKSHCIELLQYQYELFRKSCFSQLVLCDFCTHVLLLCVNKKIKSINQSKLNFDKTNSWEHYCSLDADV